MKLMTPSSCTGMPFICVFLEDKLIYKLIENNGNMIH
jgi:hypothetical protein